MAPGKRLMNVLAMMCGLMITSRAQVMPGMVEADLGNGSMQWGKCGSSCQVPYGQASVIRYGYDGDDTKNIKPNYVYHYAMGENIYCNDYNFGQPQGIPGTVFQWKSCYVRPVPPPPPSGANEASVHPAYLNYTYCGTAEDTARMCDTHGKFKVLRIGADGIYFYRLVKGKHACLTSVFGSPAVPHKWWKRPTMQCHLSTVEMPAMSGNLRTLQTVQEYQELSLDDPTRVFYVSMSSQSSSVSQDITDEDMVIQSVSGNGYYCNYQHMHGYESQEPSFCRVYDINTITSPVARWASVGSCGDCHVAEEFKWGSTRTSSKSISSSWSHSVKETVSAGFSYDGAAVSGSISNAVSVEVASSMTNALETSMEKSCKAECPDTGGMWTMWQWQMTVSEVCNLGDDCPASVWSCNIVCRSGVNQTQPPKCPYTQCADPECNTCRPTHTSPYPLGEVVV